MFPDLSSSDEDSKGSGTDLFEGPGTYDAEKQSSSNFFDTNDAVQNGNNLLPADQVNESDDLDGYSDEGSELSDD